MLLKDRLSAHRLILASRSPRRRELLAAAGLEFVQGEDYEVVETWPPVVPPEQVAQYLAELKSYAYPRPLTDGDILLTADTVVILDGRILGKPADRNEALATLGLLSGREHSVVTGVCLRTRLKQRCFSSTTRVRFGNLTAEEIEYYIDTCRPYDKAGAYGIQEWTGHVGIESIDGSYDNVMGLPVQKLYTEITNFI
jgi:septum formation protein